MTSLAKVPTNPKRGHRLGTFSATWNKIKAAAYDGSEKPEKIGSNGTSEPKSASSTSQNGSVGVAKVSETKEPSTKNGSKKPRVLVEYGPRGEIVKCFPDSGVVEVWDWTSTGPETYRGDSLNLISSTTVNDKWHSFKIGEFCGRSVILASAEGSIYMYTCALERVERDFGMETFNKNKMYRFALPGFMKGPTAIKLSSSHVSIASAEGYVLLYKVMNQPNSPDLTLTPVSSHNLHQTVTRPVAEVNGLSLGTDQVALKTSVCDNSPIFDIQGSWLVYCPTKREMDHQRHLLHSNSDSIKKKDALQKCSFTELKLPPQGPLLVRVVSSISGSALDKLYALSESGSKTFRSYWSKPKSTKPNFIDKDVSLHSISTNISQALYSTANKIKKSALDSGENKYIRIIDLENGQMIATFKPPAGVSHLSLSPYDLQLVQASLKGDSFYLWDLYRLPNEASLVGKFSRGNTSATVREIFWFVNTEGKSTEGTNSGFGCISKKKGSLHWYNINYLSCGNDTRNYPNKLGAVPQKGDLSSDQFLDSWVLPSIDAVKFFKLPKVSNLLAGSDDGKKPNDKLYDMNQLAFLDGRNNLRLVSPLTGKHTFKYVLGKEAAPSGKVKSVFLPFPRTSTKPSVKEEQATPLSQTEIETCNQYLSIINDKRFELSTFDCSDDLDVFDYLLEFGQDIPTRKIDFRGGVESPTPEPSKEMVGDLENGLLINPETSAEET